MRRFLSAVSQSLLGRKWSARVADERSLSRVEHGHGHGDRYWLSAVLDIVRKPLELVSCIMGRTDGGVEHVTVPDMDELMVRDGMRYAIFV